MYSIMLHYLLIFLLVYGVDGCLTICHRIMLHENLGEAHRKHAYQLMANELKIGHVTVSLIYMALHLQATASERKHINHDLRMTAEDNSLRMLNTLEVETKVPIQRYRQRLTALFVKIV